MTETTWQSYEQVAVYLLNGVANTLGLEWVGGKQKIVGQRSGTEWTVDGKGVVLGSDGLVTIECRRYLRSKQNQEQMGGLAYRIIDTGARGGIIVSHLGLQAGAAKVAAAENVEVVHLDQDSTTTDYVLEFLNRIFVGRSDVITLSDEAHVTKMTNSED